MANAVSHSTGHICHQFLDCLKIQIKSCPFNWQPYVAFKLIHNDIPSPLTMVNTYVTAFPLNVPLVIQSFARIRSSAWPIWSLRARSTNVHCYMASVSSLMKRATLVYLCLTFSQNFPFKMLQEGQSPIVRLCRTLPYGHCLTLSTQATCKE